MHPEFTEQHTTPTSRREWLRRGLLGHRWPRPAQRVLRSSLLNCMNKLDLTGKPNGPTRRLNRIPNDTTGLGERGRVLWELLCQLKGIIPRSHGKHDTGDKSWKCTRKRLLLFWLWRSAPARSSWRRTTHRIHHPTSKWRGRGLGQATQCSLGAPVKSEANGVIGKMASAEATAWASAASAGDGGNLVLHAF